MVGKLAQTAASLGLPFGTRTTTYNSRLAQEVGLWAVEKGRGHDFHMAAFRAYFADGRNLAEPEVLKDLAVEVKLDPEKAAEIITTRSWSQAVDLDWQRSRDLGIRAVPTFVMGDQQVVGAQSYETLATLVRQGGIERRG